ncbi:hypothetical protein RND81_14G158700 [Saponaria officinalis]|uniref:Uncharacterized protein n=1 Tax=Saponaria officinalis TaxID=3572 RepID=A0AAW1GUG0_SAPOF
MEQNVQVIAKKAWHIAKVVYFLLRKNISKRKFLLELKYLATKRPKLTGKTTYHHKNHHNCGGAYEFSCSNTPSHQTYFNHNKRGNKSKDYYYCPTIHARDGERELHAVNRVLDMMLTVGNGQNNGDVESSLFSYSPVLPGFGFGRSPVVRELRVTDSPYALLNNDEGEMIDYRVDEAADEFIKRFYDQLKQQ